MNNVIRENERRHRVCTFGILTCFSALKEMEIDEKKYLISNITFSSGLGFAEIYTVR